MAACILIVDDDDTICALLTDVLTLLGHATRCAMCCTEGIAAINNAPPDLVLLDLKLPDGTGWTVYEAMQAQPSLRRIPVVILTGDLDEVPADAGPATHCLTFLEKPFSVKTLKRTIDQHMTASHAARAGTRLA